MLLFIDSLVVGDAMGAIKVFMTTSNFQQPVLAGQVVSKKQAQVTSLCVIQQPQLGQPIVVAGDSSGSITLVQQQQQGVVSQTFGAHCDSK